MTNRVLRMEKRYPDIFGSHLDQLMRQVVEDERAISKTAARLATQTTRKTFHYKRPRNVPPRKGRMQEQSMVSSLRWLVQPNGGARFDYQAIDRTNKYWIIQEIGTGNSATLKQGAGTGQGNPQGRPAKDAAYVKTVRAQRGRRIPGSLVWATGPSGSYVPAAHGANQQLYLRHNIPDAPQGPHTAARAMYITREIHGQEFVKKGGTEGFRVYQQSLYAAAQRAFAGHERP